MTHLTLPQILTIIPCILIGLTVHEFAHSYVALMLGDSTSKEMGRTTLNPLKHIDIVGFIFIIIAGFGWAKPVMIDHDKLKNPKRDDVIISLAGPFSNFLLALLGVFSLKLMFSIDYVNSPMTDWIKVFLLTFIYINLGLFIFNLLPIPPLDGSHVITSFISSKNQSWSVYFYKYGAMLFIGILLAETFLKINILPIGKITREITHLLFLMTGIR